MSNPRLALILPSLRLYRSIYRNQLVEELQARYQLNLILCSDEMVSDEQSNVSAFSYSESPRLKRWHKLALDVETFRLRNENVSYRSRIRFITNLPDSLPLRLFSFLKVGSSYGVLLAALSSNFGYKLFHPILSIIGGRHGELEKVLNSLAPEIVVCFSGGTYSGIENFLGKYSQKRNLKLFLIIDNWDNLSSKSILWNKPTLLGVWGPEMEVDAIELHGINRRQIVYLGSSRLDLGESNSALVYLGQFKPYVLFAGSGIHFFDEIEALKELRHALNSLGHLELSVIYRPHPWLLRGEFKLLLDSVSRMSGVVVDHDILEKGSDSFYDKDSLSYLETMVVHCAFVVAGHSTVIVEALYHGKKVLALTESDHALFKTSDSWALFRHMQRLRGNIGIFECDDVSQIENSLKRIFEADVPIRNLVPDLLPEFQVDYVKRVTSALEGLN